MSPIGARPTPDEHEELAGPELELAARIADAAADEGSPTDAVRPDEQRTLAKPADSEYQQAIDDIAVLVAMRREVSHSDLGGGFDLDGPDASDETGDLGVWGPFELLERLGGGASGEVYKVRDRNLRNHVALKLFHEERVASVELDTLLVEGRQHALVKHPNIAVIHGADENDGRVGIWMEYLDGATLQELVETQGTFGAAETVTIARELCSALAAVHQQDLTHGDIKAQNVMREKGGRIVLMDFSSSRHVRIDDESSGGLVGTPIYMAPELFDDKPSDVRSDIYAVGVLMFYLATGRHPLEADNLKSLKDAVRAGRPLLLDDLRPDLPPGFIRAVNKATASAPEDRFQSAGEFQAALRNAVAADPSERVPVYSSDSAPDLKPLVRAARVVTASVLVTSFLALLGFANEFNYNAVLHVPESLTDYSLWNAVVVGLRSLAVAIVLAVIELLSIAVVWTLAATLAPGTAAKARRAVGNIVDASRRDFGRLATWLAVGCVVGVAAAGFVFRELLSLMVTLTETTGPHGIDTSLLGAGASDYHVLFILVFSQLGILMLVAWIALFEHIAPGELGQTSRAMKWLSAVAILACFFVMSTPWKLLVKNESIPVTIDGTKGYVVAENDDAWFVYIPGGEHMQIAAHSAQTGDTPENVFGE